MSDDNDGWATPVDERDSQCPCEHEELSDGRCRDDHGDYTPDAGSPTPVDGRCNATLRYWRSRYGEKRYCTQLPQEHWLPGHVDPDIEDHFCQTHSGRANVIMRAKEVFQHGMRSKSREHVYDKLDPLDRLLCHAMYESLLAESVFEFAPEFEEREFDFSESDYVPPQADSDDTLIVEVPHATEYIDRSQALWCAAVDMMKMLNANAKIANDEMEHTTTSHAEVTDPEAHGSDAFSVIEEREEHYLNLAYSRLVRDRKELLSYGGVVTGTEADEEDSSIVVEDFTTVEADPEAINDESGMLDVEAPSDTDD